MGSGLAKEKDLVLVSSSPQSFGPRTKLEHMSDDQRPIPIFEGGGESGRGHAGVFSLDDVVGPADSTTARYRKRNVIGRGAYGEAYIVERNPSHPLPWRNVAKGMEDDGQQKRKGYVGGRTPELFVAKVVDLTSMSQNDRRYAQNEIMCLACNYHFGIIHYYEHFFIDDEDQIIVIITEFADGGDLYRCIYQQDASRQLSEKDVGTYFVQLLLGLDYIHRHRMIHRDIKAANIFMTSHGFLKLGDFGFSQQYDTTVSNPIACTFLGTSYYLSPEMWEGQRYGKKADIWAAGVVLCEMLGRRRPFDGDSAPRIKELVLSGAVWLPPTRADDVAEPQRKGDAQQNTRYISREMREFLEYILQKDPSKRPSAAQLLKTPLMQHYLCVFQKRVQKMIAADDALEERYKANPEEFANSPPAYSLTLEEKRLVLQGIADGEMVINSETARENTTSTSPHMEGVVYKESADGQWRERYLIVGDGFLTMTLAKGKIANSSGERSKKVPLEALKSVVPVGISPMMMADRTGNSVSLPGHYCFAISTENSQSIVFATRTEEERNQWLSMLIMALKME